MSIKTILGSAVIAAIFSGVVSYVISKRQSNLQYITAERKEWREKIREIAKQLEGASYKKTLKILTDLKVRINSFGNNMGLQEYASDAHIWEVINELEMEKTSKKKLRLRQKQLIEYLSLLLKVDWERSKKEVKGNIYAVICGGSYALTILYFAISVFSCNRNREYEKFELATLVGIMVVLVIAFHAILLGEKKMMYKSILGEIVTSNSKKYNARKLLQCYLKCFLGTIPLVVMFYIIVVVAFIEIKYESQGVFSRLLLVVLYSFGLGFQVASQNLYIENEYKYICAINRIREKTAGSLLRD